MSDYDNMNDWDIDRGLPRRDREVRGNSYRNYKGGGGYPGQSRGYSRSGNAVPKRRKKKKNSILKVIAACVLSVILLLLIAIAVALVIQHLPNKGISKSTGTVKYTRTVDVTDIAARDIAMWLSTLEDEEVDFDYVVNNLGRITCTSQLLLGKNDKGEKTYEESITEDSYIAMTNKVNDSLETMLSKIVAKSLKEAGYSEDISDSEALEISTQVLGMSFEEYLLQNNVVLLPTKEEMENRLGIKSGTYEVKKNEMIFTSSDNETITERFIKKSNALVLVDSSRVYELVKE